MRDYCEEWDCWLNNWAACCCTCADRLNDWSHPHTDGKSTLEHRGYICISPGLGPHSGWSKHGLCECHVPRPEKPSLDSPELEFWLCKWGSELDFREDSEYRLKNLPEGISEEVRQSIAQIPSIK